MDNDVVVGDRTKPVIPEKLYIYFSKYSYFKKAVSESAVYFNIASTSNDIFDSTVVDWALVLKHFPYNGKLFLKYIPMKKRNHIKELLDLGHISTMHCAFVRIKKMLSASEENNLLDGLSRHPEYRQAQWKLAYFSEDNDNLLMWAHYGKALRGYCLELTPSLDKKLFSRINKVQYERQRYTKMDLNLYYKKSIVWQYEKEWRIALYPDDKDFPDIPFVHTKAITGIIIGERAPHKNDLVKLAKEKNLNVYVAQADSKEFKIHILKKE